MSLIQKERFQIHNYDSAIDSILKNIKNELSPKNSQLILDYDKAMTRESLAKTTRRKHLEVLLSLSRILKKDWITVTKSDIDDLVYEIMKK